MLMDQKIAFVHDVLRWNFGAPVAIEVHIYYRCHTKYGCLQCDSTSFFGKFSFIGVILLGLLRHFVLGILQLSVCNNPNKITPRQFVFGFTPFAGCCLTDAAQQRPIM